jgi:hypothetical protein
MGTSIPSTIFAAGGRRPASTSVPCSARKLKIGASYEPARRLQSRKSSMSVFVRARSLNGRAPADYCEPSKFEPSSQFNAAAIALCAAAHRSSDAELRNLPGQAIEHRLTCRDCLRQRGLLASFRAAAVVGYCDLAPRPAMTALRVFWGLCHARAASVRSGDDCAHGALRGSIGLASLGITL